MNTNNSNKRKSFIARHYCQISTNAFIFIIFIFGFIKAKFSIANLIMLFCISLFIINIPSIIGSIKRVHSLDAIKKEDLRKSDNKKIIIAASIMFSVAGISLYFLFVKGMIWASVIMLVSGNAFVVFVYTVKKAALRRKLERECNELASND